MAAKRDSYAQYVREEEREHSKKKRKVVVEPKQKSKRQKADKEHKVQIFIDAKEPVLPDIVRAFYPDLSESSFVLGKPLPTGDIRVDVDGAPCLLIERKEVHDMVSSLGTGNHFREQRARMMDDRKAHPDLILVVIVEGSFDSVDWSQRRKITREFTENICRALTYKYGIHVIYVANQLDILKYLGHVERDYKKYGRPATTIAHSNYLDEFYVGRKRALKPEEFSLMALTLVEGVSVDVSKAILEKYKTLPSLYRAYGRLKTVLEREDMVSGIHKGEANRVIGGALSKRIYNYLLASRVHPADEVR